MKFVKFVTFLLGQILDRLNDDYNVDGPHPATTPIQTIAVGNVIE